MRATKPFVKNDLKYGVVTNAIVMFDSVNLGFLYNLMIFAYPIKTTCTLCESSPNTLQSPHQCNHMLIGRDFTFSSP